MIPLCDRVSCDQIIAVALGGFRMAFLLPLEAAAGGITWMLPEVRSLAMLRNSIVPLSAQAQDQFAQADLRNAEDVAAEVNQKEDQVRVTRREILQNKRELLQKKCEMNAFQLCAEGTDHFYSPTCNLLGWCKKFFFKIDDLRRRLIAGQDTSLAEPYKGSAASVFIRKTPGFDPEAAAVVEPAPAEGTDIDSGDDSDDNVVLEIIDRDDDGCFLVRWLAGGESWEPQSNLGGCLELLEKYLESTVPQVSQVSEYEKRIVERREENRVRIARIVDTHTNVSQATTIAASPSLSQATTIAMPSISPAIVTPTASPIVTPMASPLPLNQLDGLALNDTPPPSPPTSATNKRQGVSPAVGSPAEESMAPGLRVRSSPRFEQLPSATIGPPLAIDDRVKAIWRYKEGGSKKYLGKILTMNPDGTSDIEYEDGDVERRVPRSVISLLAKYFLPPDPNIEKTNRTARRRK